MTHDPVKGYTQLRRKNTWALVASEFRETFQRCFLLRELNDVCPERAYQGRGNVRTVRFGSLPVVVRPYRRGGIFRSILPDLFLDRGRALRELVVSEHLRERGVPTPRMVAVRGERKFWFLNCLQAFSEEVAESVSFLDFLRRHADDRDRTTVRSGIREVARAVRLLHDKGGLHRDLNARNILVRSEGGAAYILDLDRARVVPEVSTARRLRALFRLNRSVEKADPAHRIASVTDRLRFLLAYFEGDRARVKRLRPLLRAGIRGLRLRRMWWLLVGWRSGETGKRVTGRQEVNPRALSADTEAGEA